MKKNTARRIVLLIMMLVLAVTMAAPISAAGKVDTAKEVTLKVEFCPDGKAADNVKFELFKVADIDKHTNLTLTEEFASLPVDLTAPDSSVWEDLVDEAESCVASGGLTADYSAVTEEDGIARFTDLSVGLYLLRGNSYVVNHDVYKPQPYLIMLPGLTESGEREYFMFSVPKYSKSDELRDVKVAKRWVGGTAETRPQEITVILYCDDAEYETVVLSAENNWQYTWSDLNAKNNWTVSEVAVEGYTTTLEGDGYSYEIINTAPEPPHKPEGNLPQTGLVWWHIPVLAAAGIVFCLAGLLIVRKRGKTA